MWGGEKAMPATRSVLVILLLAFWCRPAAAQSDAQGLTWFETRIRPVLVEHCYPCHSAEAQKDKKLKGGLRLDTRDGLRKGGVSGPALDLKKPGDSLLLKALRHEDGLQMPPKGKLPAGAIADFEVWVAAGAPDPRDGKIAPGSPRNDHWAFQPLRPVKVPTVADAWIRTPIDAFLLRDLHTKGLTPSPRANAAVLVRRMAFDLVGLPPALADLDAALASPSDLDFDQLAERWLASPQHGERWAQHWLDVARYADSAGYSTDTARPTMFHYRDFVIMALNDDLPFDRFLRLQLAGDLLPPGGTQPATGFCTCGPFNTNSPKEIDRYDELDDLLTTTGQAFLGLNLGCARCHNHKYDPVTQTEYYRLLAVFNSSTRADRPLGPPKGPTAHVLTENPKGQVGKGYFLERGDIERKREELTAGFPAAFTRTADKENHWLSSGKVHPRLALADWLVDVEHGAGALTARVIVNRLWQHHFGTGLVRTPNDFGAQGELPTHPELLEWLAGELVRHEWRLRPIHRLIVRSAADRQSPAFDARKAAIDRDNRLWWRYPVLRLEAEAIRDAILTVSGGLERTMFGPAVYPLIPKDALLPAAYTEWPNTERDDPATWRRSVYIFVKRSTPVPFLQAFDRPDRTASAGKRHLTTIVPQALHLLNDPMIRTQSELFAARVIREAGSAPEAQVRHAVRLALGRPPGPNEERTMVAFLDRGSLADLCQTIFMLNEFLYVE
jgi:hypothetical protein